MSNIPAKLAVFVLVMVFAVAAATAQSTQFTYQGNLSNTGQPGNGSFDFEFALFDALSGGSQLGSTLSRNAVTVANGSFAVDLDFGNQFPGANRFLEIRIRPAGGGAFTTLTPRQPLRTTPYSVRSLASATADTANSATMAANLTNPLGGDVTGTQSNTTVARLRGRNIAPNQPNNGQVLKFNSTSGHWEPANDETATAGGGGTITGVTAGTGLTGGGTTGSVSLAIANGGVGATQLADGSVSTAKLADGSVSTAKIADNSVTDPKIVGVSGAKVTGTVANATNAATATNATQLGGLPAASYLQTNGNGSGLTNLNASNITTGTLNNARLGQIPTANIADNAVTAAKIANGEVVKALNNLKDNVTLAAGTNITITPAGNTLTIASTGGAVNAILNQTTQQPGSNFNISGNGTAGGTLGANVVNATTQFNIGGSRVFATPNTQNTLGGINAGASLSGAQGNTFFGHSAGQSTTSTGSNSFFGNEAGRLNTGSSNAFFGNIAGELNTSGSANSFFGANAGDSNTSASDNSFFGSAAGQANTTGTQNAFFGRAAGFSNITANENAYFGYEAGRNTTSSFNSYFGSRAGQFNTTGNSNSFFGTAAGNANTTGTDNSFFGVNTGLGNTTGNENTFFGRRAGDTNTTGNSNTVVGAFADVASGNLSFATAIGAGAVVSSSSTVVIGRASDDVRIPGSLDDASLITPTLFTPFVTGGLILDRGTTPGANDEDACFWEKDGNRFELTYCASSIKLKENVLDSKLGLASAKRLRPVTYNWKSDGKPSIGLIAEEVNEVDPLLANRDREGSVRSINFQGISAVLIKALQEQQVQIEATDREISKLKATNQSLQERVDQYQTELAELKKLFCSLESTAKICGP